MTQKNDGGPAFPSEQGHTPDGLWNQTYEHGMSLRDWFAGQAMQGWLASYDSDTRHPAMSDDPKQALFALASQAYAVADALLAHREKQP